jgi:hypothetical protein
MSTWTIFLAVGPEVRSSLAENSSAAIDRNPFDQMESECASCCDLILSEERAKMEEGEV